MILIVSDFFSERLTYISNIIFHDILGTKHAVLLEDELKTWLNKYPAASVIFYTQENSFGEGAFSIPNSGFLAETDIKPINFTKIDNVFPFSFLTFHPTGIYPNHTLNIDVFSVCFILVTQYYYYTATSYDEHNRYLEKHNPLIANGLESVPIIEQMAHFIWDELFDKNFLLHKTPPRFDYQITIDVDAPFFLKGRDLFTQTAGCIKNLLLFNFKGLKHRLAFLLSGKDIYNTHQEIISQVPTNKLKVFFLLSNKHKNDGSHSIKSKSYQKLIKQYQQSSVEIGIHPSYNASLVKKLIFSQKNSLEQVIEQSITNSRFHFLQYRYPKSYQFLLETGVRSDYSLAFHHATGFVCGLSRPFFWFDVSQNQQTELLLYPSMVMDRALLHLGMSPDNAQEEIQRIISVTRQYNGFFILLWHNTSLSDSFEWKGWKSVFSTTIKALIG